MTAALSGECGAIEPDSAEIHPIEKTIRDFHLGRLAIDHHAVDFRHGLAEVVHHLGDGAVRPYYGTVTPAQPIREASRHHYTHKQQQSAHGNQERLTASARKRPKTVGQ